MGDFYSIIKFKEHGLGIFFGDKQKCPISPKDDQFKFFCKELCNSLSIQSLVVQKQVHGVDGRFINKSLNESDIFTVDGDFLATDKVCVGLGVLTADCLPIIFFDKKRKAVAIAHAGWRGAIAGIAIKTIEMLVSSVKSDLCDIIVYFGPSAGACCYEVQQDFCDQLLSKNRLGGQALIKKNKKTYFDQLFFNKRELVDYGILPENIIDQFNLCTICHEEFHSFRRNGKDAGRQVSCAWIIG